VIFFNWEKVVKLSGGKAKNVVRIMVIYTYGIKLPKYNKNISQFYRQDITGDSFLLNPKEIFKNRLQVSLEDMATYIELASLRNYLDYEWYSKTTLPLRYTEITYQEIKDNPLLDLDEQDNIKFYYEDEKDGN
jgi:hypothetical protein